MKLFLLASFFCLFSVKTIAQFSCDFNINFDIDCSKKERIEVYPNPTADFLTVVGLNKIERVSLFNYLGQFVQDIETVEQIDVRDLVSGIYFLKFRDCTKKFIK